VVWGDANYGGAIDDDAWRQLRNVRQIQATQKAFAAILAETRQKGADFDGFQAGMTRPGYKYQIEQWG
jgi:hypothetical protein